MTETQVKAAPPIGRAGKILRGILSFLLAAAVLAFVTQVLISLSNREPGPAGFLRGVVHGALMPGSMPNLLIGKDVTIYAPVNTGRTYKLGYTVGVNGCGAVFFGFSFWRINRWRKKKAAAS